MSDSTELDLLVTDWLTLPDLADRLDLDVAAVRRLIQDRFLVAVRRGEPRVLSVPAVLLRDGAPMPELPGTVTLLEDCGFDPEAALRWLLSPDDSAQGSPIAALHAGHKTEVRRRAQALAF